MKQKNKLYLLILIIIISIPASIFAIDNFVNEEQIVNTQSAIFNEVYYSNIELSNIPEYTDKAYVVINNNEPFFTDEELNTSAFEKYSNLDYLGRCGAATACVGKEIMPTEKRGEIGNVKPSGWHTVRYSGIEGNYLYNRCHLIGYQLSGENDNEKNLITGTRYMNVTGMLPFENAVESYVSKTNNHVLYRVTPIFKDNNLVASGVLMEAKSIEDNGKGIKFNVYCYNVQPGIEIDYKTGDSSGPEYVQKSDSKNETKQEQQTINNNDTTCSYVINTNNNKFHYPDCSSVSKMSKKNRSDYNGKREDLIKKGYTPCSICNP